MSQQQPAISEDDLHAYVDNQLDPGRRDALEHHLEQNETAARRVQAYTEQRAALRAAFAISDDPVPATLDVWRLSASRVALARRNPPWQAAAAVLLAFAAGGGGGWLMHGQVPVPPLTGIPALAQEAGVNHFVFAADHGHAVEIRAAQSEELERWFSSRLNRSIVLPDLKAAGYRFMGGRLVATEDGPAAMLMYDDDHGTRITVYARPMASPRSTKTIPIQTQAAGGYAWICDGLGYAVVSGAQGKDLRSVASSVRHQVDPS
jgi:anti-sigma factor RsiW